MPSLSCLGTTLTGSLAASFERPKLSPIRNPILCIMDNPMDFLSSKEVSKEFFFEPSESTSLSSSTLNSM